MPDLGELFDAIPKLKETLRISVELAAPSDFIPPLPGWEGRSQFECQEGKLAVYHYDFYSQALAKIERGHAQDLGDVREMIRRSLVDRRELLPHFERIAPALVRYPAIQPGAFRRKVERIAGEAGPPG